MRLNKDTRVFITGCGGMLGQAVFQRFDAECTVLATDIDLNESWLEFADVRNYEKTFQIAKKFTPHIIINLAALTDLEYCERNINETWKTNALGAENMALIAAKLDAVHVYIGTAGIFDGALEYYTDFDQPNPLNVYARAKYYGERAVQQMSGKHFVFRAGWMMGGGPLKDKKFVNKIYKQLIAGANELFVVDDKLGTPTYTINFADSMFRVIQTELFGLYNMVCGGSCSRYEVARELLTLLELDKRVNLTAVDSKYFEKDYFVLRPRSEKLINLKLESRGLNFMRDWRDCLKEYSAIFKADLQSKTARKTPRKELVAV